MTSFKRPNRRWVTHEQYLRFFVMCRHVLDPDVRESDYELREELEVCASASCSYGGTFGVCVVDTRVRTDLQCNDWAAQMFNSRLLHALI